MRVSEREVTVYLRGLEVTCTVYHGQTRSPDGLTPPDPPDIVDILEVKVVDKDRAIEGYYDELVEKVIGVGF